MTLEVDYSVSEALTEDDEDVPGCPRADLIASWAQHAFLSDASCRVSVQVLGEREMQQLNHDWRGKDYPTNVLSFPMAIDPELDAALLDSPDTQVVPPLGDIALCAAVINREAHEQGKAITAHWAHMVVHGTLHLQGYDHIDDNDAAKMEALEIQILQSLGFDNPYQTLRS